MDDPKLTFNDSEEIQLMANQLTEMANTLGWKKIKEYFTEKLKYFDFQLREGDIQSLEDLRVIRARRDLTEQFINLPEILPEMARMNGGREIKFDPYSDKQFDGKEESLDPYSQIDSQSK